MACVYALLLREGADTAAATSSRLDRRWTARRNPGVRLLRRSAAKGGLYLRLGAIVFGIASMIRDGIALAASLQHGSQLTNCSHPIVPIRGALSILFTFVQLNFLFFMNAKMCINKYQVVARFFLAHLVATNTCVWLRTVLLDSSLRTSAQSSLLDRNHSIATIDRHLSTETPPAYDRNSSCATDTDSFIRDMIWKSDPYLFPVTVQYCALSAAILCAVWQNVGQLWPPRRRQILGEDLEDDDDENVDDDDDEAVAAAASAASESAAMDSQQSPHRLLSTSPAATYRRQRRNTCDGSHRGLCLGLASLVCAAVALLTSAALWQQPRFHRAASLVSHCSELALLAASLAATLAAFPRLADLLYEASKQLDWPLDEALQLLGFGGGCLYWLAGLVPSGDAEPAPPPHRVLTCLAQPVQAAAQLALLCTARRRRCYKALHAREKPGRELVTYLLVANIALLGFATAEPSRGSLSVIERIGLPMHCLYRCHSVALLPTCGKKSTNSRLASGDLDYFVGVSSI
ncbi:hypothetical protein BOX15_Mlig010196g1 [Macrostomum lignano]|uniref:Uncharacterized protein n=1 Tax=Macrostomum lignano TaxID=282301 RepID=A0A267GHK6_9PLAT|nr:hypothetical protein BOX15_Mlig010196g1 [Macrostomum lignano]